MKVCVCVWLCKSKNERLWNAVSGREKEIRKINVDEDKYVEKDKARVIEQK